MFNIVQRRKWYFLFSGLIILAGLIAMAISIATYPEHSPVRLSIDFIGGTFIAGEFKPLPDTQQTRPMSQENLPHLINPFPVENGRIQPLSYRRRASLQRRDMPA